MITPDNLGRMIGTLRHRGPDESGIYLDPAVGLASARLSIIDLPGGTQPIHNEDESLWIVYNGEVFNYLELREDLLKRGHSFYTNTDTEVLLHLYEDIGPDCLERVNGQFAFAIWDARKEKLFLARDRLGIRPLYYTVFNGAMMFASEVKAIFANEEVSRRIDPAALDQVFTFWSPLPGGSMFSGVSEIPPGHYMTTDVNGTEIRRYWDIPFREPGGQEDVEAGALCEQVTDLLEDAVRIRLRADVPVGSYISGGLDSSGVTALVVREKGTDVTTFGIRFAEDAFDEGEHQERVAGFLGTKHHEAKIGNAAISEHLPEVIRHTETVMLRTAPVPLFELSRLVHETGLKVVLTGEGADEVFGGYNIFREAKVRRFWSRRPDSESRPLLLERLYPYVFKDLRLRQTLRGFFGRGLDEPDHPLFSHLIRWEGTSRLKTFFSDEVKSVAGSHGGYDTVLGRLPDAFDGWDYLSKAQYIEMMTFLGSYLLSSQGDRVAMGHSVEIRLPYLDYRLLDLMAGVPAKLKIRGLNEKYVLKRAFEGVLPPEITGREKQPYRAPIKQSLLGAGCLERTLDTLSAARLRKAGYFDEQKVARLLKKLQNADEPGEFDSMALVGILTTQLLHEQFVEDMPARGQEAREPDLLIDRRGGAKDG